MNAPLWDIWNESLVVIKNILFSVLYPTLINVNSKTVSVTIATAMKLAWKSLREVTPPQ
jgi:hypothetical protein